MPRTKGAKGKKEVILNSRLLIRLSSNDHAKISNYAKKNNTEISTLIRNFIKDLES
jgi:hypothetical protein